MSKGGILFLMVSLFATPDGWQRHHRIMPTINKMDTTAPEHNKPTSIMQRVY